MKHLKNVDTVLLAVDFTQPSNRAFAAALRLARAYGAGLQILHVNEEESVFAPHNSPELTHFLEDIAKRRAQWLGRYQDEATAANVPAETLMREGAPAETILSVAEEANAGVIVIGTQGSHGLGNMLPGSVARKILRTAQRPVLVVSRNAGVDTSGGGTFERILYPTDFSTASRLGLAVARDLMKRTGAHLTIGHVLRLPRVIPSIPGEAPIQLPAQVTEGYEEEMRRELEAMQRELGDDKVDSDLSIHSDAADGISELASSGGIDLVVMPRHSSHSVGAFFFGSTAERLVKLAPVPVLLFNPLEKN